MEFDPASYSMTEEVKPKGTPYGQAMALLQEFAESLPAALVILPDHVLWPSNRCALHCRDAKLCYASARGVCSHGFCCLSRSQGLSVQTFQLLDQAAAVLSAVHARHIPLALLIASDTAKVVRSCLEATSVLAQQFAAVVRSFMFQSTHSALPCVPWLQQVPGFVHVLNCLWFPAPQ